ncbi:serine/threonine-protein kinase [Micromonospora sp. WMMD1120]|uniref:serine/threonine-protein kinase n=1 Tax=Micromonospora sp. WMMD1120 TaxID=3016106 RepID=UPI002415B285|nr:serine/threonine-protein kinase [Micromonospora sp. WMMD1120]MDG4811236.1 serine/threonine-protein kinase [Micromonospora sp. WMMD1120]
MLIAGRYRLLDLVGRGGMGRVWRAHDEMLHREIAVKEVVPPSWLTDRERDEVRSRTLREARTAARLNHPAVVRLYDVIAVEGSPWIVMEYVPSRTLQDVVDAEGPLEPAHAARIGLAVLDALQAAHTAGVLHRDIKPQNVLVAHDGRVMLTDFGLATFDGGDGAMTRPGMVLGSPQYVAPERAAEGVSTVAADLWSLGATLHAAVEGRSPYARSTAMATLSALAAGPPDPAPHAGMLAPVLAGLLRRDPRERLDHDEARRLLTAAATGRVEPPPTADPHTVSGRPGSVPGLVGQPVVVRDGEEQEPTVPLPDDSTAPSAGPALVGTAAGATPRWMRGSRTARRLSLIAVALLVAVAAGVGTALTVADDEPGGPTGWSSSPRHRPPDGGPGGPGPGPDGAGPPPGGRDRPPPPFACVRPHVEGSPVLAGDPAPGERFRPPRGWVWHADTAGFHVAVPATWYYSRNGEVACFQDPVSGRALSVAPGNSADPLVRLRAARDAAIGAGALPGYDEIRLAANDDGAEWECRWQTPYGGPWLRARQQAVDAGRWALGWITHDEDWAGAADDWKPVRESFRTPR